ncbi:MAG: hypothetical protein IT292_01165 [Deltaproteobacteria bacterium]|nr:hypothetical protein [Deltaproteobacteria bacterium]
MPKSSATMGTMGRKQKCSDSIAQVTELNDLIAETKTELKIALQGRNKAEIKRNADFLKFLYSVLEQMKPEQEREFWPTNVG